MWKTALCGLAAIGLAGSAAAQISGQGGPIRIKADRSEVLDNERQVVLIDNVDITQGDARLRADQVILSYAGEGGTESSGLAANFGDINTMEASGSVFYVTPDLKATGDRGVYVARTDTITLTGDVVLLRGEDVAKGSVLTMELRLGRTSLDGGVNMVITPAEEDSLIGRSGSDESDNE